MNNEVSAEGHPDRRLDPQALPEAMPVAVIMRRHAVNATPWATEQWQALAVLVPPEPQPEAALQPQPVEGKDDELRYEGLSLQLHKDQCESYYYNMLSENPRLFVLARPDEDGRSQPFHVSASSDEAGAGMEGDEQVFSVAVPPEIYKWIESYVLIHYQPERKFKRKLTSWEEGSA